MTVILIDKLDSQIEHAKNRLDQFITLELPEKIESKEKSEEKEDSSESNLPSFKPQD